MKGFTNIKLYDVHGNVVKDQDDNNMITNLLSNFVKAISSAKNNKSTAIEGPAIEQYKSMSMKDLIGGILLFDENIEECEAIVGAPKVSVCSGGTKYDYSNPLRGSLNDIETGPTTVGDKKAYRWTWDFGTSNGNCTFNCVCLSDKLAGDRRIPSTYYHEEYKLSSQTYTNVKPAYANNEFPSICVSSNGTINKMVGNKIVTTRTTKSKTIESDCKIVTNTLKDFPNKNISGFFQENDTLHCIVFDNNLSTYQLIKMNADTLEEVEVNTLAGFQEKYNGKALTKFGYVDTNKIITNIILETDNLKYDIYDVQTSTFETFTTPISLASKSRKYTIASYKIGSNKYASRIGIFSEYSSTRLSEDITIYERNVVSRNKSGSYNGVSTPMVYTCENGISIMCSSGNGATDAIYFTAYDPIFTINNLESAITKTEANTMKISYTLIME